MKNPWMSLWLSAANRGANTARGLWMAEAKRQQAAAAKDLARMWGLEPPPSRRKPAPKRRAK